MRLFECVLGGGLLLKNGQHWQDEVVLIWHKNLQPNTHEINNLGITLQLNIPGAWLVGAKAAWYHCGHFRCDGEEGRN